jgi:hypothetical protein
MEWLFGSETVDLTSAQRAIDQLASDRDALEDKVTKLGEILTQQRLVPISQPGHICMQDRHVRDIFRDPTEKIF